MAFDPVTAGLEALTAGLNLVGGQQANKTARENLDFQRQNAADTLRFAKAGRTDAYGDTTSFNDALNQWITELSPEQQRIVKAGEHEQLQGLTTDATNNRLVRQRQFDRGNQAAEDYNTERAGYLYDKPRSEAATYDDITKLINEARGTGDRAALALADRQGIRQGGNVPVIRTGMSGADSSITGGAGAKLAQIMLQARGAAHAEAAARNQEHQSRYLPALNQFQQVSDMGGNAPFQFSTTPRDLANTQNSSIQGVLDAMKQGGTASNTASTLQAKTEQGQFGDMSKLIAAINNNKAGAPKAGDPGYFGGSPGGNDRLSPITYGNRNYTQDDYGDFTF